MTKKILIYRKKRAEFNSIENVFDTLLPFLDIEKIELPFFSQGILNRLKNILFILKKKKRTNNRTIIHTQTIFFDNSFFTTNNNDCIVNKKRDKYNKNDFHFDYKYL